jgi:hypothetical protein
VVLGEIEMDVARCTDCFKDVLVLPVKLELPEYCAVMV